MEKIFTNLATDMIERLRIDYFKNEKRMPQSLVVGIRKGEEKVQKNHTLSFPKWRYVENNEKDGMNEKMKREEEDRRNRGLVVDAAMNLFKSDVKDIKVSF